MYHLANGYTVTRVDGTHLVNGVTADTFRDDIDRIIIIADPGDPDELVDLTAFAVERAIILDLSRAPSREHAIEILHSLLIPKAPLIPEPDQLPFGRRATPS